MQDVISSPSSGSWITKICFFSLYHNWVPEFIPLAGVHTHTHTHAITPVHWCVSGYNLVDFSTFIPSHIHLSQSLQTQILNTHRFWFCHVDKFNPIYFYGVVGMGIFSKVLSLGFPSLWKSTWEDIFPLGLNITMSRSEPWNYCRYHNTNMMRTLRIRSKRENIWTLDILSYSYSCLEPTFYLPVYFENEQNI